MSASGDGRVVVHEVETDEAGLRLDVFCARRHPEHSRSFLSRLIRERRVLLNDVPAKPRETVAEGARVELRIPPLRDDTIEPEAIPLDVLYEDETLLVVNKPAGLVVHPGAGARDGTLAAALIHRDPRLAGVGGPGRPGIVHRLDRGTSGAMVVARTEAAYLHLQRLFEERRVEKVYLAITWGRPRESEGEVDRPIGRHPSARVKMAVDGLGARPALSTWRTLTEVPGFALLEVRISTGRTHQVRVHLDAIGHPIVGDVTYAGDRARSVTDPARRSAIRRLDRPALHAWRLAFEHPDGDRSLDFEAPVPRDLLALWEALGGRWP
jgi:23S rRNA pseudouridine1911/1915/1917 synthase